MKTSVSLPAEDVEFLDRYGVEHRIDSRSSVLAKAWRGRRGFSHG